MPETPKTILDIQQAIVALQQKIGNLMTRDLDMHLRQIKNLDKGTENNDAVNLTQLNDAVKGIQSTKSGLFAWLNRTNIFQAFNTFLVGLASQFIAFIEQRSVLSSPPQNVYMVFVNDSIAGTNGYGLMFKDNRSGGDVTLMRFGASSVIDPSWFFGSDIYPDSDSSSNCGGGSLGDNHYWKSVGANALYPKPGTGLNIGDATSPLTIISSVLTIGGSPAIISGSPINLGDGATVNLNLTGTTLNIDATNININGGVTFTGNIPNTFTHITVQEGLVVGYTP